ncbi:hypothetical protein [uncultured Alistipes sp.]|uniref:hypothetical protein n=1 Tax=uncultured Alistipes sp. TaxID=538949 RepID=UPI002805FC95|nr:hypothetical protein [uncultured Alistipes sp.]
MDSKELRKKAQISRFPKDLDAILNDESGILEIHINNQAACANMQGDSSAFEGWIFCIYAPLSDIIKKVILRWTIPNETNLHYNRFLYRVIKMQKHFKWFSIAEENVQEITAFQNRYKDVKLVLNQPSITGKQTDLKEKTEAFFERVFLEEKQLYKGIQFDTINNQLPVGLFFNSVSKSSSIFPGNKGAIDLWGIRKDEFWIFELKFENRKVGILSEILFYLWMMEDLFFTRKIGYDPSGKTNTFRDLNQVYDLAQKGISKLYGVLLVDQFHACLNDNVIDFINRENQESRIKLKIQLYRPHVTVKLL